jgi:hypothetical protein
MAGFALRKFTLAAAVAAGCATLPLARGGAQTLVPIPSRTYIGINPIGVPADIGTVELESGVAQGVTLGGVASYIDVSGSRFTTFDFKFRYYPAEVVLRGYSVGATVGVTRFSNDVGNDVGGSREALTAPTVGVILDYNWLYGREQHFLLGTGIGAKRVLAGQSERDRADVDRAVFTARLIVGYAF